MKSRREPCKCVWKIRHEVYYQYLKSKFSIYACIRMRWTIFHKHVNSASLPLISAVLQGFCLPCLYTHVDPAQPNYGNNTGLIPYPTIKAIFFVTLSPNSSTVSRRILMKSHRKTLYGKFVCINLFAISFAVYRLKDCKTSQICA